MEHQLSLKKPEKEIKSNNMSAKASAPVRGRGRPVTSQSEALSKSFALAKLKGQSCQAIADRHAADKAKKTRKPKSQFEISAQAVSTRIARYMAAHPEFVTANS